MWDFMPLEEDNFSLGSFLNMLLFSHRLLPLGFLSLREVEETGRNGAAGAGGQKLVTNGYTAV